jgi:glutathione peroxidase
MTEKILVNGDNCHPLYAYLRSNSSLHDAKKGTGVIGWNFGKFLVNGEGQVVEYYPPTTEPIAILADIKKLLL